MNLSYRWLQTMVPGLALEPEALAELLAGLCAPVDEIVPLAAELGDVVIARVLESGQHPNADRLSLCRVDAGTGEALSVVCGAPNVRAGAWYPFAPVGSVLPGGVKIRKAKIRGEVSEGMLCSERELHLGRDHAGIMELSGEFEPGQGFVSALGLDDVRLVADVTANRPDLLSHMGFAREIGAALGLETRLPALPGAASEGAASGGAGPALESGPASVRVPGVEVSIEAPDLCLRYLGAVVRGVRIGPSPEWLKVRLRAIGVQPINNVVDCTNYVLAERSQPLHAFDLGGVGGGRVVVRRAAPGESIVTLDGERRALKSSMLVIADAERPMAVAGVMGGEDSEVTAETTDLLLECALFDPAATRATRRALGLSTDASYRYERGVDPDGMVAALQRALELITATAGGRVEMPVADVNARPWTAPTVSVRPERVGHVLGIGVGEAEIREALEPLGFREVDGGAAPGGEDSPAALAFRVPGYRFYDVAREVDLIEEIARRHGYEAFPEDLHPFRPTSVPDDGVARLEDRLRDWLVGRGCLEAHAGGFAPEEEGDVPLLRPLSAAEDHLRRALLPGLIHRVEHNFAHGVRDVRLFEIGTVFEPGSTTARGAGAEVGDDDAVARQEAALPRETRRVAAILTGARRPPHWTAEAEPFDVWDIKGLLREAARELGLDGTEVVPMDEDSACPPYLERAGAFQLVGQGGEAGASPLGVAGSVAADAVDAPPWAGRLYGLELDLPSDADTARAVRYAPLPEYPASERDLALLVPAAVAAGAVEAEIRRAAGARLESVYPFDVYRGEGMESGQRSIAYRLRFRSAERTLTDEEVDAAVARVLGRLKEALHVERRG